MSYVQVLGYENSISEILFFLVVYCLLYIATRECIINTD